MEKQFTPKQLSKIFSLKESMIYRWCNEGKVIFEKKCGRLRIDFSSVKKMFDNMPEERYIPKENKQKLYEVPFEDGLVLRVTKEQLDLYKKGVTSEELFRRKAFVRVFATNRKG